MESKTCFNCKHYFAHPDSVFVDCKCVKRVPVEAFDIALKESIKIDDDNLKENVKCKYWMDIDYIMKWKAKNCQ